MSKNKYLTSDLVWALTDVAIKRYTELLEQGFDPDLAYLTIEQEFDEDDLYRVLEDNHGEKND